MVNTNVRSYQRGNQNPLIEGQTINWPQEMIEDTRGKENPFIEGHAIHWPTQC
jgi:hypothetical protein